MTPPQTQTAGRLAGCADPHNGPCNPYDGPDNVNGLWACPRCRRTFCLHHGDTQSPLCDECWGLGAKVRRRHPWRRQP